MIINSGSDWLRRPILRARTKSGRVTNSVITSSNMAEAETSETTSTTSGILQEIFTSPLNLTLLSLCLYLVYKILRGDKQPDYGEVEKPLPKMKKRDFTLEDLKPYDGVQDERILMAVNGKVFDVTRGKKFYGPGKEDECYSWHRRLCASCVPNKMCKTSHESFSCICDGVFCIFL